MKYKVLNFLITFFLLTENSLLAYKSAHVIIINEKEEPANNEIVLGLTKKGKLSTFGGMRNQDEVDPKDTAARETEEEALGLFGDRHAVRSLLQAMDDSSQHPNFTLTGKFSSSDLSDSFKKIRFDKSQELDHSQKEMIDLVAVKIDLIKEKILKEEELLFQDNDGHYRPLRYSAAEAIKSMLQNKL